ncbi:tetratricopeptide repeat protein [Polaribacter sp. Asnod1-A03]|uniref:tetratricopeptide repeat protein n=1 Tax=Polaribacter sp. Asnod1-A03 TaxID=3160581 RepID=UPI0038671FF4
MIYRIKIKKLEEKRGIYKYKLILFSLFFVLFSMNCVSQDSIPIAKDLTEEKELNFQQYFFKALSEKSIGNYQKALENLENCNQIISNNVAVFFEFSKNYFLLKNTLLAKEYINRALKKEPNNIWMLKHLVKIELKEKNFSESILIQEKIVALDATERDLLIKLYLQNNELEKSLALLNIMEKEKVLSPSLKRLKTDLERPKKEVVLKKQIDEEFSLLEQFEANKSYAILKEILLTSKDNSEILKYSSEGISLFPAQPFVYLMQGKALNYKKEYNIALTTLQSGIDFVIEDKMEVDFYKEMAKSYKGLGNFKEEEKLTDKIKKMKI